MELRAWKAEQWPWQSQQAVVEREVGASTGAACSHGVGAMLGLSFSIFFFNKSIYLFIFGCLGSSLLCSLSLVVVSRGYSSLWRVGFSLWWLLLLRSKGSRRAGFSSCDSGSRAQAQ